MDIEELGSTGFGILGHGDSRKPVKEILRQREPLCRTIPFRREFGGVRHQLEDGVERKKLNPRDFVHAFLGKERKGALHLGEVSGVPVAVRTADAVSSAIEQHIIHAPAIDTHAGDAAPRFGYRKAQSFEDLLPQTVQVPYQVARLLTRAIGKPVDLLQDSFLAGPAAKDYAAAFRSQIRCHNMSAVFHSRHSSPKC